jgi:hypothetical protein
MSLTSLPATAETSDEEKKGFDRAVSYFAANCFSQEPAVLTLTIDDLEYNILCMSADRETMTYFSKEFLKELKKYEPETSPQ